MELSIAREGEAGFVSREGGGPQVRRLAHGLQYGSASASV